MNYVDEMGALCGERCEVIDTGTSYEGNVVKLIKVWTPHASSHCHCLLAVLDNFSRSLMDQDLLINKSHGLMLESTQENGSHMLWHSTSLTWYANLQNLHRSGFHLFHLSIPWWCLILTLTQMLWKLSLICFLMLWSVHLKMVSGLDTDPAVMDMLSTHDWYILPCVNPDGYIYTHTTVSAVFRYYSASGVLYAILNTIYYRSFRTVTGGRQEGQIRAPAVLALMPIGTSITISEVRKNH